MKTTPITSSILNITINKAYIFQNEIEETYIKRNNLLLTAKDYNIYAQDDKATFEEFTKKLVVSRNNENDKEFGSDDEALHKEIVNKRIERENQEIKIKARNRRMKIEEYTEKILNKHHSISILNTPALSLIDELKEYLMIRIYNL